MGSLTFPAEGVDYSFQHPNVNELKAAGVRFVGRYLSGSAPKQLTHSEAISLLHMGFHILLFWEQAATAAQRGRTQGITDAKEVALACHDLDVPSGVVVYFAVDYELTPELRAVTAAYLQAAKEQLAVNGRHAGAYGGFATMGLAQDARIPFRCQTLAWSDGRWDEQATVWQTGVGVEMAGGQVDKLRALRPFGGWSL